MRILGMAFRNVGRNRRRSALALSSVAISILLVMVMDGLMTGFLGSIVKNYTKNETGHVNIATEGYRARERFMPIDETIASSREIVDALAGLPGLEGKVQSVAERIRFGVVLSSGPRSKAALGIAGDPEAERSLLMLDRSVKEGAYLAAPGDAILGERLAEDLGLGLGDTLKVVTQKADSGLGFKRFRVAGIFRTGVNSLDEAVFQVGIADARELLGLPEGASQQLLVILKDYRDSDKAAGLMAGALGAKGLRGLSVQPWTAMGDFLKLVKMAASVYYWMYAVVAFLGAFIITNIMMMVVLERRKEIGVLKSMGMPSREVLALFLAEGTMLGALGAAVGAGLGLAFNAVFSKLGFDFTSAMSGFDWPMDNIVYPRPNVLAALAFFAMGTAVAAIVSLLPARSAARMNPVEAIRSAV
ncbi:MAG TPA: FtsX-like permease family protein [Spirochaetales bacterium]|nr:FtsX-like permease family protein [Spirochaetales bacterium]